MLTAMPDRYRRTSRGTEIGRYVAAVVNIAWRPFVHLLGPFAVALVLFLDEWRRWVLFYLSAGTVLAVAWDLVVYWNACKLVDWILLTGFPIGLFVLYKSSDLHRRFNNLARGLARQGILEAYEPGRSRPPAFRRELPPQPVPAGDPSLNIQDRILVFREARGQIIRHAAVMSVLVGALFLALSIAVTGTGSGEGHWELRLTNYLAALKAIFGLVVGIRLGRIAAYGIMMWTYPLINVELSGRRFRLRLDPQPGHPDHVCGLKPIGDFWSFEATVLILPLAYILAWIGLMNTSLGPEIQVKLLDNHSTYVFAAMVLLLLQVFALWVPMLSLRRVMGRAKQDLQGRADELAQRAANLKYAMLHANSKKARDEAEKRHEELLKAFQDFEQVPLWPISARTLRSYVLQLWPILGFVGVENKKVVQAFVEFFQNLSIAGPG